LSDQPTANGKHYVVLHYQESGTEVYLFSSREKANTFCAEQAGRNWEQASNFAMFPVKCDERQNFRLRRWWWCQITLTTGKERSSGKHQSHDFVDQDQTHTIEHSVNAVKVRSYVSLEHARELCRTEAAALGAKLQC
jgi:hypothetical protein